MRLKYQMFKMYRSEAYPQGKRMLTLHKVLPREHSWNDFVNDQLDAQFFYFITRLLQSSTCFEQRRAHHQEVKLY